MYSSTMAVNVEHNDCQCKGQYTHFSLIVDNVGVCMLDLGM